MQPVQPQIPAEEMTEAPAPSWRRKLGTLLFIVVCFEVGLFLLVFPWAQYWRNNFIAGATPWVHELWNNNFFRGALSGLGVLNLYISIAEVLRLRRRPADRLKVSML